MVYVICISYYCCSCLHRSLLVDQALTYKAFIFSSMDSLYVNTAVKYSNLFFLRNLLLCNHLASLF